MTIPTEVQELINEIEAEIVSAAQAAPTSEALRILAGKAEDARLQLLVRAFAALEAAYTPRTVSTVEEVRALPVGTVILESFGGVHLASSRISAGWWTVGDPDIYRSSDFAFPAVVLFVPDTKEGKQWASN